MTNQPMAKHQPSQNKPFEGVFMELSNRWHSIAKSFSDFLELVVSSFSQDEEKYKEVSSKYNKDELELFTKALAELVLLMEQKPDNRIDILWEFYEKYISLGHNWQFFTPEVITDFMAQITCIDGWYDTFCDENEKASIKNKQKSVCDPCCGSGRMLLSLSKRLWNNKRKYYYYWADLDRTCCLMCLINLFLNWVDWEIYHMNSLSFETYDAWAFWLKYWIIPYVVRMNLWTEIVKNKIEKIAREQKEMLQSKDLKQGSLF